MKSIILVALLCATALALPSKPAGQKLSLVELYKEQFAPKLAHLQLQHITRANLNNLLKAPGLRELVDQFLDSAEGIYNLVDQAAGLLAPLIKKYSLNKIIEAQLPQIAEHAGAETYQGVAELVDYLHGLGLSDEDTVSVFIAYFIFGSAVYIPYYTTEDLYNVIDGVNAEAGEEFRQICTDLYYASAEQVIYFVEVLINALLGMANNP